MQSILPKFRSLQPLLARAFSTSLASAEFTKGEQILYDKLTKELSGAVVDVQDTSGQSHYLACSRAPNSKFECDRN